MCHILNSTNSIVWIFEITAGHDACPPRPVLRWGRGNEGQGGNPPVPPACSIHKIAHTYMYTYNMEYHTIVVVAPLSSAPKNTTGARFLPSAMTRQHLTEAPTVISMTSRVTESQSITFDRDSQSGGVQWCIDEDGFWGGAMRLLRFLDGGPDERARCPSKHLASSGLSSL